jgi:hypothetical protein
VVDAGTVGTQRPVNWAGRCEDANLADGTAQHGTGPAPCSRVWHTHAACELAARDVQPTCPAQPSRARKLVNKKSCILR